MARAQLPGIVKDWAVALGVALCVFFAFQAFQPKPPASGEAVTLALPRLDGSAYVLAADEGRSAYVVNFWATWCAPCREEIPDFAAFAKDNPDVAVLGVSVDSDLSAQRLEAAARKLGITYTVLHDAREEAARQWGVSVFPTTIVLDADRRVVGSRQGMMDRAALERLVALARE